MEPILDETSLVPCQVRPASMRIHQLARAMLALDGVGTRRVLRSVRDAADRDLGGCRGLRTWCFDRSTPRDAGRLVAARLAAQPFIDGEGGLFEAAEGQHAVEARVNGSVVVGIGFAALTDGVVVLLPSDARPDSELLDVDVSFLDDDGLRCERVAVRTYAAEAEVDADRAALLARLDLSMKDGVTIVRRINEVLPRVVLGAQAVDQISRLNGSEPFFRQLVRHLRALDEGALLWRDDGPYRPGAVTFSVESQATLADGTLGPMRDFPTPEGFTHERWSLHTKLTGGRGARMYFRPVRSPDRTVVLIGYFGDHLPTVRYRT